MVVKTNTTGHGSAAATTDSVARYQMIVEETPALEAVRKPAKAL
jgi:hypothetical protein